MNSTNDTLPLCHEITLRARVWGRIQTVRALVEGGDVLVWDNAGGYYTHWHDMSASGHRRARAMARAER